MYYVMLNPEYPKQMEFEQHGVNKESIRTLVPTANEGTIKLKRPTGKSDKSFKAFIVKADT